MHLAGIPGHPRRISDYPTIFYRLHSIESIGTLGVLLSLIIFCWVVGCLHFIQWNESFPKGCIPSNPVMNSLRFESKRIIWVQHLKIRWVDWLLILKNIGVCFTTVQSNWFPIMISLVNASHRMRIPGKRGSQNLDQHRVDRILSLYQVSR